MASSCFYVCIVDKDQQLDKVNDDLLRICRPKALRLCQTPSIKWHDFAYRSGFYQLEAQERSLETLLPFNLTQQHSAVVVLVAEGNIVCYAHMRLFNETEGLKGHEHQGHTIHYEWIATQEEHQALKHARVLLNMIERAAENKGYRHFRAEVSVKSRPFWENRKHAPVKYAQAFSDPNLFVRHS